jgi:hypothetical protein
MLNVLRETAIKNVTGQVCARFTLTTPLSHEAETSRKFRAGYYRLGRKSNVGGAMHAVLGPLLSCGVVPLGDGRSGEHHAEAD